jgi:ABC-type transport system involved in cytochrome c biogenesis permease subunit
VKTLVHTFGSMKIGVALLAVLVVALAAGTMVESARGTPAAAAAVYGAVWFRLLLAFFALNVACSIADLWPWGWKRAGFLMTHGSILVILAGALVTDRARLEGQLPLWEGEEGGTAGSISLPFRVRLDAFEIDYYQGTRRPAMFRSRVTVTEPSGRTFPAVIEMNRELRHAGYRLFQSSYQQTPERDQTILLVSRDPGQAIVFAGYTLLLAGMTTVLLTRVAQARALARIQAGALARGATDGTQRKGDKVARAAACVLAALVPAAAAGAATPDATEVEALRRIPVQHDGRVMPLDTLAREAVWHVTGRRAGSDAVALVTGWAFDPARASSDPVVRIGGRALAAAAGIDPRLTHTSFRDLVSNRRVLQLMEQARAEAAQDRPVQGVLEEAQGLEERLVWMQGFLDGSRLAVIPLPGDPAAAWSAPHAMRAPADLLEAARSAGAPAIAAPLALEVSYNRVRPSRLAWWILAAATAASVTATRRVGRRARIASIVLLATGFAVMTWGIGARWVIAGRIPASNMYESLLFLGWGVGLFAVLALLFLRNRLVVLNASAMAALTMALTDLLPVDPFIHPMPPVLSGTAWLAIHVPIIMLSYSVLALGVFVAHLQVGTTLFAPARRDLALRLNDLLYWYIHIGSILLIAGILTGSIWAASSWGRAWGWDPKEVWSLIAFLAYLAILHGRFDRLIGTFGVAALSIVAFWTVLMTYIGVNYVLGAGLHSYGFGGSGVVRWMLAIAALEVLFLGAGFLARPGRNGAAAHGAVTA